jgi:hypothetical protein
VTSKLVASERGEKDGDTISQMEKILLDNSKEESLKKEINNLMEEMRRSNG